MDKRRDSQSPDARNAVTRETAVSQAPRHAPETGPDPRPKEIGGRKGPDPTRYGDWEKNGRCIDF